MSIQPQSRIPFPFVDQGFPLQQLPEQEIDGIFQNAILDANEALKEEGIVVFFKNQIPENQNSSSIDPLCNILLGIRKNGQEECIDIIDIKALDQKSIKPFLALSQEIVCKVRQHVVAKKIQNIVISSSGSKFDTRKLRNYSFKIDKEGYIRIDGNRVAWLRSNAYWILKAEDIRSYTIIRLVEEGQNIRIFDDYDLVRSDNKGMYIEIEKVCTLSLLQIQKEFQRDAESYDGNYFLLCRDALSSTAKARLTSVLHTFSFP